MRKFRRIVRLTERLDNTQGERFFADTGANVSCVGSTLAKENWEHKI